MLETRCSSEEVMVSTPNFWLAARPRCRFYSWSTMGVYEFMRRPASQEKGLRAVRPAASSPLWRCHTAYYAHEDLRFGVRPSKAVADDH